MLSVVVLASLVPVRVDHAPHIDGQLDDAVWQTTPASDSFTQSFPHDGERPTSATHVRVAYDDTNIYVAIDCTQTVPIVARLTRRDRDLDGDRVSIDFDTSHDRRGAFHFQLSAAGVMVDALRYGDTELSTEWDEVWRGEVAITPTGWSAELAIPLRILRLRAGVEMWGFQVRRYVGESGEIDTWAYAPRDAGGEVSRYGELGPFVGLAPRGSIALVPFALSRVVHTDPGMPSQYGDGVSGAGGIDMTFKPAQSITIAGAVLPDFAQVEADQTVVTANQRFPIFFEEKRPFFFEGSDLFQTP
ncbi:MAG TPA: sugar-binding protein, partial [Kofleriaceae bacterium]